MPIKLLSDYVIQNTEILLVIFALAVATLFSSAQFNKEVRKFMKKYGNWIVAICLISMVFTITMLILGFVSRLALSIPFFVNNELAQTLLVAGTAIVFGLLTWLIAHYIQKTNKAG